MSHCASVIVSYTTMQILSTNIIEIYLSNGWNLNDYGNISYRPLGDKDDSSWMELELNQKQLLMEIIDKKTEANEDPAVALLINETDIGALVTFLPRTKQIDFVLMINRKILPSVSYDRWTDFSWYLPHIMNPLFSSNIYVDHFSCFESV